MASSNRPSPPVPGRFDLGIKKAVDILRAAHVETFESCEGGPGHAYTEPTVAFHGSPEAGWRALAVCFDHRLPVLSLRRVWEFERTGSTEPVGPRWELVFRERVY